MVVGEIGVEFILNPSGLPEGTTLIGSTVVMYVSSPSSQVATGYPMTVASGGLSANYITVGTEFMTPGIWKIQFFVTYSAELKLKSLIQTQMIYPSL